MSLRGQASADLIFFGGILSNAIPSIGWMLMHILSPTNPPELRDWVMDEIKSARREDGSIDVPLLSKLPLLNSMFHEVLRVYIDLLIVRQVDADTTIPGPGQVQNTFNSDPLISSQINLLRQGQSEVINGNLLTLPVGGGLLYVQPVFVQASSGTQLPQLQKVLVAFGNEIAFEDTLNEALDEAEAGAIGDEPCEVRDLDRLMDR